jgi:hypothetical protein
MTANTLNALKGWAANMNALDFHAAVSANVTVTVIPGMVAHLNSVGQLELGVSGFQMPLFVMPNNTDPDVTVAGGNAVTDVGAFVAGVPAGQVLCLVATGAYELASTFYDLTQAASYVPNAALKAIANNSSATGGQLTIGIAGTDTIVGVVSRGVVGNGYGFNSLAFWTCFLPVV